MLSMRYITLSVCSALAKDYKAYAQCTFKRQSMRLKGPKHEIFESGFFTEIRPVRIGDLGTGEIMNFR